MTILALMLALLTAPTDCRVTLDTFMTGQQWQYRVCRNSDGWTVDKSADGWTWVDATPAEIAALLPAVALPQGIGEQVRVTK